MIANILRGQRKFSIVFWYFIIIFVKTSICRIFPRIVRPLTTAIGNCTYRLLVNLKLLKKVENVVLPSVVEQSTIELDEDSAANRKRYELFREFYRDNLLTIHMA
jgi:hypothetical protein